MTAVLFVQIITGSMACSSLLCGVYFLGRWHGVCETLSAFERLRAGDIDH